MQWQQKNIQHSLKNCRSDEVTDDEEDEER